MVVDATGRGFVANAGNNSITEYAPEMSGNVAPTATIAGTLTGLDHPQDLALDAAGDLFGFLILRDLAIALLVGVAGIRHGSSKSLVG